MLFESTTKPQRETQNYPFGPHNCEFLMGFLVLFEGAHTESTTTIDTFGAAGNKDYFFQKIVAVAAAACVFLKTTTAKPQRETDFQGDRIETRTGSTLLGKSANAEITRDQTCWFNFRSFGDANFVTKCSLGVAYANRLRARREKAKKATTAARSPLCDPLGADRRAARSGTRCSLHPRDRVAAARSDPETRRPRRAVRVRRVTRNERENIPNDPGATDL